MGKRDAIDSWQMQARFQQALSLALVGNAQASTPTQSPMSVSTCSEVRGGLESPWPGSELQTPVTLVAPSPEARAPIWMGVAECDVDLCF